MTDLHLPSAAPESLRAVCEYAIRALRPWRILLFGSWARGDQRDTSDFDLAFDLDAEGVARWSRFVVDMLDQAPTLHRLDLIRLDECDAAFRRRILAEGKALYDATP
jgi:predicted nucleotidyltransferase